ncbi:MAG: hypothetical protein M3Y13_13625 [Armatimonadota bacterium]|nr:hypothetical protein [Armatimonadota bacterium]
MTLTLDLSPEQEAALHEKAAQEGKDEREYALRLLDDALGAASPVVGARPFYETATAEEWIDALNQWARSHDPNGPVLLDDSREIIYED